MKRLVSLLLALMMCLCTANLAIAESTPTELTIAVVRRLKDISESYNERAWAKDAEKALNLKLNFVEFMEGAVDEPLAAVLAGDLPDVFFMGMQFGETLITQNSGLFRVITEDDLKTYAPNYYSMVENNVEGWREYMTYPDGNMYGLMGASLSSNQHQAQGIMYLNYQWLENLGLEEPTTLEEFYDMLVAFRDGDPNGNGLKDEIPVEFCNNYWAGYIHNYASAWGLAITPSRFYNVKDGVVEGVANTPAFREFLEYFHMLGQENLLNLEGFSQTSDQYAANIDAGKVGMFWTWTPVSQIKDTELALEYEGFVPIAPENYHTKLAPNQPNRSNRNGWVITKECENWETALALYDYWCEPSRALSVTYGPEGIGWEWMDDEKTIYEFLIDPKEDEDPEGYAAWVEKMKAAGYEHFIGKEYSSHESIGNVNNGPLSLELNGVDMEIDPAFHQVLRIKAMTKYTDADAIGESIPKVIAPAEAQEELDFMTDGMNAFINGFIAESVINGVTDESWEAFQADLEKYNYSFYIEWYNKLCNGEL